MKIAVFASLLVWSAACAAQSTTATASAAAPAPGRAPPGARPSDEAIRAAVRATLAERPGNPRLHEADTLRANRYDAFARQVEDATVPDCLHAEGLKRQPTFFLGGLLALPFIPIAWIRGKCQ